MSNKLPNKMPKNNTQIGTLTNQRSRGVALIMAILITSLVSIAAVAMITQQQLEIRRTQNILQFDQAYVYVLGAEAWAKNALVVQDQEPEFDAYPSDKNVNEVMGKPIAQEIKQSGLDIGGINGIITDASAAFPLNMLVDDHGGKNEAYFKVFEALVANNLENHDFQSLEYLALDWIDKGDNVSPGGGAEDNDYLNIASPNRPYRTPNRPIASVSELRLMLALSKDPTNMKNDYAALARPGFNPLTATSLDDIEKQPLVNALPRDAANNNITININTAPSAVLKALVDYVDPGISDEIVKNLVEKRKQEPLKTVEDFTKPILDKVESTKPPQPPAGQPETPQYHAYILKKNKINEDLKKMVDVKSEYFYLTAKSQIGDTEVVLISVLHRSKDGKVTTVRHGIGVI
jgi:general secretion pathway protein K